VSAHRFRETRASERRRPGNRSRQEGSRNARDRIASGAQHVMLHTTRERSVCQPVFIESVRLLRSSHPVAAEAVLALGMLCRQGALSLRSVTHHTVFLDLEGSVFGIRRDGRVVVLGRGQQHEDDDDGQRQPDGNEIGFLEGHLQIVGAQFIAPMPGGINPAPTCGRVHLHTPLGATRRCGARPLRRVARS